MSVVNGEDCLHIVATSDAMVVQLWVGDQVQKMIVSYADSYNNASMTDEQGMAVTKDYLKLKKSQLDIRQKYVSKFGKIISGKSVMRFYQVENKLDVIVDAGLASEIPLVK